MMDSNPENKKPEGEKLDEITSEITNIMKLERLAAEAESEADAVRRYDILIAKIKTHIKSRVKRTVTPDDDKMLADIIFKYRDDKLEQVKSETGLYCGSRVMQMTIGNDTSTRVMIHSEDYEATLRAMIEQAYARLKEKKIAMYDELKEIISDEFDLTKNLAHDKFDSGKLQQMIKERRRDNGT